MGLGDKIKGFLSGDSTAERENKQKADQIIEAERATTQKADEERRAKLAEEMARLAKEEEKDKNESTAVLPETEYFSLQPEKRVSYVYNYLKQICSAKQKGLGARISRFVMDEQELATNSKSFENYALYIAFFMIDSQGFSFSGYNNALSPETNLVLRSFIDSKGKGDSVEEIISLLHNNEAKYVYKLTEYDEDKEMYLLERAAISIFAENTIPSYYRLKMGERNNRTLSASRIREDIQSNPKKLLLGFKDGDEFYCETNEKPIAIIRCNGSKDKKAILENIVSGFLVNKQFSNPKLIVADFNKMYIQNCIKDIPNLFWPIFDDDGMIANMLMKLSSILEKRLALIAAFGSRSIEDYNSRIESSADVLPYIYLITDDLEKLNACGNQCLEKVLSKASTAGVRIIYPMNEKNMPVMSLFKYCQFISAEGLCLTSSELKINSICEDAKEAQKPEYEDSYYEFLTNMSGTTVMGATSLNADSQDSLYDDVVEFVKAQQKASTSLLQRRFGIGYNRAARLIDTLEDRGVIGPANGSKPREVYIEDEED